MKNSHQKICNKYDLKIPEYIYPKKIGQKIIAIGDTHGDLKNTILCLKLANVIDNQLNWIGKDTIIVQVGDQIDSCRPGITVSGECNTTSQKSDTNDDAFDIKCLWLFTILHNKAIKYGGAVYSLLGNHELMNVLGDMRFVSHKNIEEFGGLNERIRQFHRGNKYARFLGCTRNTILIIDEFLFVHGGILSNLVNTYNIKEINEKIRDFLLNDDTETKKNKEGLKLVSDSKFSPLWTRDFGKLKKIDQNDQKCKEFDNLVKIVTNKLNRELNHNNNIKTMIIGHTPQFILNYPINSICNNKIWRIDSGSSKAFNVGNSKHHNYNNNNNNSSNRNIQVLEIIVAPDNQEPTFNVLTNSESFSEAADIIINNMINKLDNEIDIYNRHLDSIDSKINNNDFMNIKIVSNDALYKPLKIKWFKSILNNPKLVSHSNYEYCKKIQTITNDFQYQSINEIYNFWKNNRDNNDILSNNKSNKYLNNIIYGFTEKKNAPSHKNIINLKEDNIKILLENNPLIISPDNILIDGHSNVSSMIGHLLNKKEYIDMFKITG